MKTVIRFLVFGFLLEEVLHMDASGEKKTSVGMNSEMLVVLGLLNFDS